MDVKAGSGAFMPTLERGTRRWRRSIVGVARGAGLADSALLTEMGQCLGHTAGNAVEVAESHRHAQGRRLRSAPARGGAGAVRRGAGAGRPGGGPSPDGPAAADRPSSSGAAAERFGRMVAALGGPADLLERTAAYLPALPERHPCRAVPGGLHRRHRRAGPGPRRGRAWRRTAPHGRPDRPRGRARARSGASATGSARTSPCAWSTRPTRTRPRRRRTAAGRLHDHRSRRPPTPPVVRERLPEDRSWTCRRGRLRATGQRP